MYPQFCRIQNISGAKQPMMYLSMYMSVHFQIEIIYSAFSKKHQALNLIKIASCILKSKQAPRAYSDNFNNLMPTDVTEKNSDHSAFIQKAQSNSSNCMCSRKKSY